MSHELESFSNRFAVLGWGSLIWSPRDLQRAAEWSFGGPHLPVEFTRIADDGRLTLVIDVEHGARCGTWFCPSPLPLTAAIENLAVREGCDVPQIGAVTAGPGASGALDHPLQQRIAEWCRRTGFSGAVWTGLPSTFETRTGIPFSVDAAMTYLGGLRGPTRERAFEYIRRAPTSTDTPLRRAFENRWGRGP